MNSMDKVICIQDGVNKHFPDRPHISRGEIYHILDVLPHSELEEASKLDAASGDWYQFVEIPYYHWSGLFRKLKYDEQLEELDQLYNENNQTDK